MSELFDFSKKTDFSYLRGTADKTQNLNNLADKISDKGIFNIIIIILLPLTLMTLLLIYFFKNKKNFLSNKFFKFNLNTLLLLIILTIITFFIIVPTINRYYTCIKDNATFAYFINNPNLTIKICEKIMQKK